MRMRLTLLFLCMLLVLSTGGVYATWKYAGLPVQDVETDIQIQLNEFDYTPDMPVGEVSLLQRLSDILNNLYEFENNDNLTSREYLLERTIRQEWNPGDPPYVGSMETWDNKGEYADEINALFGDILDNENYHVSFILKNENLIGPYDGLNEIAIYSTSDPLDYSPDTHTSGEIVGVYVSVFTPVVDENNNIIGYELLCDSMYGFCNEIHYNDNHPDIPSFSTTNWRDNIVYWHHSLDTQLMPDDATSLDGQSLYKYDYASYNSGLYTYPGYPWGYTNVWIQPNMGKTMSQKLYELLEQKNAGMQ